MTDLERVRMVLRDSTDSAHDRALADLRAHLKEDAEREAKIVELRSAVHDISREREEIGLDKIEELEAELTQLREAVREITEFLETTSATAARRDEPEMARILSNVSHKTRKLIEEK